MCAVIYYNLFIYLRKLFRTTLSRIMLPLFHRGLRFFYAEVLILQLVLFYLLLYYVSILGAEISALFMHNIH